MCSGTTFREGPAALGTAPRVVSRKVISAGDATPFAYPGARSNKLSDQPQHRANWIGRKHDERKPEREPSPFHDELLFSARPMEFVSETEEVTFFMSTVSGAHDVPYLDHAGPGPKGAWMAAAYPRNGGKDRERSQGGVRSAAQPSSKKTLLHVRRHIVITIKRSALCGSRKNSAGWFRRVERKARCWSYTVYSNSLRLHCPSYYEVIVKPWEQFTGRKVERSR